MNRTTIQIPGRNYPARTDSARGGHAKAATLSPLQQARAQHRDELREYVRSTVERVYGGPIPPLEGGWLFREMSERTGATESVLMELAVGLEVWQRSALVVIAAWKLSEDAR